MSSGSYFTIYRKLKDEKASIEMLDAIKNEYFLANKSEIFSKDVDEEKLKQDMPLLMHSRYKADFSSRTKEDERCNVYYDAEGIKHEKLLDFHFCSSFTCLKEHFNLNAYRFKESSTFVSKSEAQRMLQAIEYVLSENYSKKFEQVLSNEYVEMFGNGYSLFDDRFKTNRNPIYIDKNDDGYVVNFSDHGYDREIEESDDDIRFNLNRTKACLLAFLNAEEYEYENQELVLEYSAY